MSERNNCPNRTARKVPIFGIALTAALAPVWATLPEAAAQEARSAGEFNRPFGMGYGEETRPIDGSTRDANGNRVVVNGRRAGGIFNDNSGVYSETAGVGYAGGPAATATAIGNNLTVITQGSWNTVIVDAEQINEGDQEVSLELKGPVDG
jgi:holdfast attachment protein HfaA